MRNRLVAFFDELHDSYWFIPAAMSLAAAFLAFVTIRIDRQVPVESLQGFWWLSINSPEGQREVLSTIASSMITVAGVVFSLAMVVLSLASQQYGPLIVGNFMRDLGNQAVLGTFTSTFLYCLLVLRTVRSVDESIFVPHISSAIGLLMALISLAVLIYYIHHVADSIRSTTIIGRINGNLRKSIEALYPESLGQGADELQIVNPEESVPENLDEVARPVPAQVTGYVQLVDTRTLLRIASQADIVLKLRYRPGDFVVTGTALAQAWPAERIDERLIDQINDAFVLGGHRSMVQDIEYVFTQMVEVAVRALSSSYNDPFTATMCIDRLSEALCRLASRRVPSAYRYDASRTLRIIASPVTFERLVDVSFDQIRHYGGSDVQVASHLLRAITLIGECNHDETREDFLRFHAELIRQQSRRRMLEEHDQREIDEDFVSTIGSLTD